MEISETDIGRGGQMTWWRFACDSDASAPLLPVGAATTATNRLRRPTGEASPPELGHLVEDAEFATALEQAVDYARHSVSPGTEAIYPGGYEKEWKKPGQQAPWEALYWCPQGLVLYCDSDDGSANASLREPRLTKLFPLPTKSRRRDAETARQVALQWPGAIPRPRLLDCFATSSDSMKWRSCADHGQKHETGDWTPFGA